ncbi:MAG: substrate-binding domain-containing protein [Gemmatimonas sp.]
MSSLFRASALAVLAALIASGADARTLRVCADPNNLPYSNERGEGFENRIADVLARDLGADVEYTWWAQRRGFVRNTIKAGLCDVVIGVPANFEMLRTTRPYYRSGYVFVTAHDSDLDIASFDDPRLRTLRVGVQMIGNDASNTPPAHALARRGIIDNVRGYMIYGDYADDAPTARVVDAVAKREVDVAIVWGPQAGYFARREPLALSLTPVSPRIDGPTLPMVFDIAIGVRREDNALRQELDRALGRHRTEIAAILDDYGVPRLDAPRPVAGGAQ